MKEKYGFVYRWYDKKHNRYYIGAHWGDENDRYICSSKWMLQAYKKRKEDFLREILEYVYTSKKDTFIAENKYLHEIKDEELGKKYYNLRNYGFIYWIKNKSSRLKVPWNKGIKTGKQSEETIKKRSETLNLPDVKEKRSKSMKNKVPWNKGIKTGKQSEETIKKRINIRKLHKNFKHSEKSRIKMSNAHKGKNFTEKHKKAISNSNKGK